MSSSWSAVGTDAVPFTATPHLTTVSRTATSVGGRLRDRVDEDLASALRDEATVASLRLDGSPIRTPVPPDAPEPEPLAGPDGIAGDGAGGWLEVLGRDDVGDERLTALEYRGLRDCLDDGDLAHAFLEAPIEVMVEMHRRATRGLVDPARQGRWRTTDLAVHDASLGHLLLRPAPAETVPSRMDDLAGWLDDHGHELPVTAVSGIVHLELLLIHPFASANGRLARTAARLALRAGDLDADGVIPVESVLADDPIGYLREAAATQRRRDLTVWLERWSEAVAAGARRALRRSGDGSGDPPDRATAFVAERGSGPFTLIDYRDAAGVDIDEAQDDLIALLDAGLVRRVLGSRGLRFTVV